MSDKEKELDELMRQKKSGDQAQKSVKSEIRGWQPQKTDKTPKPPTNKLKK